MLHAAAMLCGFIALWLLTTQRLTSVQDAVVAVIAALICVVLATRLGARVRSMALFRVLDRCLRARRRRSVQRWPRMSH